MKLDAKNITTRDLDRLCKALRNATAAMMKVSDDANAGKISPDSAAKKSAKILAPFQIEKHPARYFRGGEWIRKIENDMVYARYADGAGTWFRDAPANAPKLIAETWKDHEISAHEGEP